MALLAYPSGTYVLPPRAEDQPHSTMFHPRLRLSGECCAMTSRYLFRSIVLCALPTLLLAGCGGGTGSGNSQQPPPPTTYQLTVMAPAPGSGTVMSSPAGINCPGTCSASFAQGAKVTLT